MYSHQHKSKEESAVDSGQEQGQGKGQNPIVKSGNVFFMPPRCGRWSRGHAVKNTTIETQTRRCLEKMNDFLVESGSSLDEATYVLVLLRKAEDYETMNQTYASYFKRTPPLRTVIVGGLPQLDMLLLMGCVACSPARSDVA
jgi:2-iminobutanoate/2-iminopropanoate deaminase